MNTFAGRTYLSVEWWFTVVVMGLVVAFLAGYLSRWFDAAYAWLRHRRVTSTAARQERLARLIAGARASQERLIWIGLQAHTRRLRSLVSLMLGSVLFVIWHVVRLLEPPDVTALQWFILVLGVVALFAGGPDATQALLYEEALRAAEPDWPDPPQP
jgi:hypothetical protein